MSDRSSIAAPSGVVRYPMEFRGRAGEYFRIWFVNLCLTIITLGVFSAWAKVRTLRYFRGNTFVADHSFDYHASPVRILIGRLIAVALLVGYNLSKLVSPYLALAAFALLLVAFPWLIVSSLRFSTRNTSYRNVRFNFTGTVWGAAKAFILWSIAGLLTLGLLLPLAHKKRDYFIVNHHTYGGKHFSVSFTAWKIYGIYLLVFVAELLILAALAAIAYGMLDIQAAIQEFRNLQNTTASSGYRPPPPQVPVHFIKAIAILYPLFILGIFVVSAMAQTMILNLVLNHMKLDENHEFEADLSVPAMTWIMLSNFILVLISLGLLYPYARVRMTRYQLKHLALWATDLESFASEAVATQGAIGEELASFFDIDIGL